MDLASIVAIIGLVGNLVPLVEKMFAGFSGAGAVKKDIVTTAVTSAIGGLTALSTGGQKATLTTLQPAISSLIDSAVAIMNGVSMIAGGKAIVDTGTDTTGAGAAKLG